MCAIIGAVLSKDFDQLCSVFIESSIRGLHATGLSYVKGGKVYTEKAPVPAKDFNYDWEKYVNEDGKLYLIGHCRYSTSDLEYNQPISNETRSIVHNGVITQEMPENWLSHYGYECETKNDSELVLKSDNALLEFPDASMAVCELFNDKRIVAYRNGKRPIYMTTLDDGVIFTSTKDISKRAGINGITTALPARLQVIVDENVAFMYNDLKADEYEDLQYAV